MLLKNLRQKLFRLLIFLLPTQLAFHFWPSWSLLYGIRIDYFAPTVYLTDLIILIFSFLFLTGHVKKIRFSKSLYLVFGLVAFSIANIYFAEVWQLALMKWFKAYELILLGWIVVKSKIDFNEDFVKPFSLSVLFFSIITIVQFSLQRNIGGVFYLLGERTFNLNTPGISTVTFLGKEYLRGYSTFSHPNSLGGFFLVALGLLSVSKFNEKLRGLARWGRGLAIVCIILSFSLSAYLGLLFLYLTYFLKDKKFLKKLLTPMFYLFMFISLLLPVGTSYLKNISLWEESFSQRLYLAETSGKIISRNPLLGIGLNNFIVSLTKVSSSWPEILQPVHNIFLLVFTELGIVGLLSFFGLLLFAIRKSTKKSEHCLAIAVLLIVFTGLFDHYWFTLNQNQLLLTLVLAFSFA